MRGWIFFDGSCGLCDRWRREVGPVAERRGFHLAALQEPWVQRRLGLHGEVPEEMKLERPDGRILGGVDALVYVWRFVWWAWPLFLAAQIPLFRQLLWRLYRPLARHRHQMGACPMRDEPPEGKILE